MNTPPRYGRGSSAAARLKVIVATFDGGTCMRCLNPVRQGDHMMSTGRHSANGWQLWTHYPTCNDYLGQADDLAETRGRPLCRGCWTHHRPGESCPARKPPPNLSEIHGDRVAAIMGESDELDPDLRRSGDAWMGRAACREYPVELFYPDDRADLDPNQLTPTYKEARQVCHTCAVRRRCLEWALTHNERDGMWGGLSPQERRGLALTRRRQ